MTRNRTTGILSRGAGEGFESLVQTGIDHYNSVPGYVVLRAHIPTRKIINRKTRKLQWIPTGPAEVDRHAPYPEIFQHPDNYRPRPLSRDLKSVKTNRLELGERGLKTHQYESMERRHLARWWVTLLCEFRKVKEIWRVNYVDLAYYIETTGRKSWPIKFFQQSGTRIEHTAPLKFLEV